MIYGFMHICAINHWREIVKNQELKILNSGLFEHTEKIFISILGDKQLELPFSKKFLSKCEIIFRDENIKLYEFPILKCIYEFCKSQEEPCKVWYIHTKGVHNTGPDREAWRNFMEYFVIEHWKVNEILLDRNLISGILWYDWYTQNMRRFFAGNFWWANSNYVKTLPDVKNLDWNERFNAESWLGTNCSDVNQTGLAKFFLNNKAYTYSNLINIPRILYPVLPPNKESQDFDVGYYLESNTEIDFTGYKSSYEHYMSLGCFQGKKARWLDELIDKVITKLDKKEIYGYIYVNQKEHKYWKLELESLLKYLSSSGLIKLSHEVLLCLFGDDLFPKGLDLAPNVNIARNSNVELDCTPVYSIIRHDAQLRCNYHVWYATLDVLEPPWYYYYTDVAVKKTESIGDTSFFWANSRKLPTWL
jgi:hypothetical protein